MLLKRIGPAIAEVIAQLFQSFMSIGRVPEEWKQAFIKPLYKKGPSSDPASYRPVSLTSVFSKLMEKIIVEQLLKYLLANNLISKQQHGFLSRKSTATNLLESLNDWTVNMENKHSQSIAYIDFATSFCNTNASFGNSGSTYGRTVKTAAPIWMIKVES